MPFNVSIGKLKRKIKEIKNFKKLKYLKGVVDTKSEENEELILILTFDNTIFTILVSSDNVVGCFIGLSSLG